MEVSQRTYDLLLLESVFVHKPVKEILDELVERHITENTKLVYDQRSKSVFDQTMRVEDINATMGTKTRGQKKQKSQKLPLHKNIKDQEKIANLYKKGVAIRKISREVGIPEGTIRRYIKKLIAEGALKPRSKVAST
jgi:DNA-binding NarL/FixJ family response regulator